ncbi:hypothetical protein FJR04_08955 [Anabaena sp. UHCC 0204]|nr:hypothetical protein [Anabaena sp. UHCC 0204]
MSLLRLRSVTYGKAKGKSKEVLGDFTFLHIPLNFSVHLLKIVPKIILNKFCVVIHQFIHKIKQHQIILQE